MIAILDWMETTAGKAVMICLLILATAGGYFFWLHEHDAKVLAVQTASLQVAAATELTRQAQEGAAAVSLDAKAQIASAAATADINRSIANAVVTNACVDSPAMAVVLHGLLNTTPASPGGAVAGAPGIAGMP